VIDVSSFLSFFNGIGGVVNQKANLCQQTLPPSDSPCSGSIKDRTALEKAFKRRGACFHIINDYSYTLPRMMGEMEDDNFSIESADPL
jgi:hypothetical protein